MMQMSKVVKRSMLKSNKFIAPFRMTNDNPSFEPPKATNVKIHGDLKENNKITITADVNGGVEVISVVQWYKTTTIELDIQNGLEEITMCTTEKEFLLPIGVSGYYIVAKYTPMTFDGKSGEPVFVTSENVVESEIYTQKRKVRGKNHNKKVASLKTGEKLPIVFYNNRAVEENHQSWSRHLGRIVRNPNICPIRVKSWKEIGKKEKDHMWESVKDKFENPDMELYRDYTLEHMNTLWVNWRSCLNAKYVKPCKTIAEALKNKPEGMEKEDWEWLTKNFFTKDFQKISSQASQNRAKSSMPHRTGSKPHRQIIYEMGGKEGNPPDMGILFFETRKKDGKLVEPETEEKHLQIVKTIQAEPTLSTIEVIEKCFGAQHHSNVFGYGGGIKRKNFKDPRQKKMDELQAKLHNKDEENRILKRHIAKIEERLLRIEHFMQQNPNVSTEFPLSELDQELHKNDV